LLPSFASKIFPSLAGMSARKKFEVKDFSRWISSLSATVGSHFAGTVDNVGGFKTLLGAKVAKDDVKAIESKQLSLRNLSSSQLSKAEAFRSVNLYFECIY